MGEKRDERWKEEKDKIKRETGQSLCVIHNLYTRFVGELEPI